MQLMKLHSLIDNYIWILYNEYKQCLIFDPGESNVLLKAINSYQLNPVAILLTHHHSDHTGGVKDILNFFSIPVYGPDETKHQGTTNIVNKNNTIYLLNRKFIVMELPGHTKNHIGFYSHPWLFSGDTIFSAGCGRVFEGTVKQMYKSLQKINQLPCDTLICASHEYTLHNLSFVISLFKEEKIVNYQKTVKEFILEGKSSLPTTIYLERQINPFLQPNNFKTKSTTLSCLPYDEEWKNFAVLRRKKDKF